MQCFRLKKLLRRYMDGELRTPARERVMAHLSGCEACRDQVARARELNELLNEAPTPTVPTDFFLKVLDRVDEGAISLQPSTLRPHFFALRAATLAVVLLAILSGFKVGQMITSVFTRPEAQAWTALERPPLDQAMTRFVRENNGDDASGGRQ